MPVTDQERAAALEAFEAWLREVQKEDVALTPSYKFNLYLKADTIRALLTEPRPQTVDTDHVRAGFIIWNFDTKMNDLLYHIGTHYNLTLKDCEVCENTGRVEADVNGNHEYVECVDCPRYKITP